MDASTLSERELPLPLHSTTCLWMKSVAELVCVLPPLIAHGMLHFHPALTPHALPRPRPAPPSPAPPRPALAVVAISFWQISISGTWHRHSHSHRVDNLTGRITPPGTQLSTLDASFSAFPNRPSKQSARRRGQAAKGSVHRTMSTAPCRACGHDPSAFTNSSCA